MYVYDISVQQISQILNYVSVNYLYTGVPFSSRGSMTRPPEINLLLGLLVIKPHPLSGHNKYHYKGSKPDR